MSQVSPQLQQRREEKPRARSETRKRFRWESLHQSLLQWTFSLKAPLCLSLQGKGRASTPQRRNSLPFHLTGRQNRNLNRLNLRSWIFTKRLPSLLHSLLLRTSIPQFQKTLKGSSPLRHPSLINFGCWKALKSLLRQTTIVKKDSQSQEGSQTLRSVIATPSRDQCLTLDETWMKKKRRKMYLCRALQV